MVSAVVAAIALACMFVNAEARQRHRALAGGCIPTSNVMRPCAYQQPDRDINSRSNNFALSAHDEVVMVVYAAPDIKRQRESLDDKI
jgi:hypothetical protein